MAPVPYTPNGRLDMIYFVNTLEHRLQLPVNYSGGPGTYSIDPANGTDPAKTPTQVIDLVWTLVSALYHTSVLTPGWTLYQRVGNAFVPIDTGSASGGPGTSSTTPFLGTQLSFTFADLANHRSNFYLFETSNPAPGKSIINTTPSSFAALISSVIAGGGGANIGDYRKSRGDSIVVRPLRWTNTLSRAVRKRRGLA